VNGVVAHSYQPSQTISAFVVLPVLMIQCETGLNGYSKNVNGVANILCLTKKGIGGFVVENAPSIFRKPRNNPAGHLNGQRKTSMALIGNISAIGH